MTNEKAPRTLTRHAFWDAMAEIRAGMSEKKFIAWAETECEDWRVRAHVIKQMAWNDRNSEYYLSLDYIMKTKHFPDDGQLDEEGDEVSAEIVVADLERMIDR